MAGSSGIICQVEKHIYGNGKTQLTPEKEGSKEKELSAKDKDKDKDKDTKESSPDSAPDSYRGKISLVCEEGLTQSDALEQNDVARLILWNHDLNH